METHPSWRRTAAAAARGSAPNVSADVYEHAFRERYESNILPIQKTLWAKGLELLATHGRPLAVRGESWANVNRYSLSTGLLALDDVDPTADKVILPALRVSLPTDQIARRSLPLKAIKIANTKEARRAQAITAATTALQGLTRISSILFSPYLISNDKDLLTAEAKKVPEFTSTILEMQLPRRAQSDWQLKHLLRQKADVSVWTMPMPNYCPQVLSGFYLMRPQIPEWKAPVDQGDRACLQEFHDRIDGLQSYQALIQETLDMTMAVKQPVRALGSLMQAQVLALPHMHFKIVKVQIPAFSW